MKRILLIVVAVTGLFSLNSQILPFKLEELTAPDFIKAVEKSSATCILPIGVFEKHGPHMPLGTDLYIAREIALRAAEKEYSVVFPWYYFSQINEARQQPGTIAYSHDLIWRALQETLDELSRNGFRKIIIVNGHGGNNAFLEYFGMTQLDRKRDYVLYWFRPQFNAEIQKKVDELTQPDPNGMHAGNSETAMVMAIDPSLVHTNRANQQTGNDEARMNHLKNVFTGIWWYARFPNHYSGDGSKANAEAGELLLNNASEQLIEVLKSIKSDEKVPELYQQFYNEAENPLKTKQ